MLVLAATVAVLAGTGSGSTSVGSEAVHSEQARDDRRFVKLCAKPRFLVPLTEAELSSFNNATKLLTEAKLCGNTQKPEPPREPGCLIENVVKGGAFDKLSLKSGDWLIGDSGGAIKAIDRALVAVDEIRKHKHGCLVVTRSHWTFAIGYLERKPHLVNPIQKKKKPATDF